MKQKKATIAVKWQKEWLRFSIVEISLICNDIHSPLPYGVFVTTTYGNLIYGGKVLTHTLFTLGYCKLVYRNILLSSPHYCWQIVVSLSIFSYKYLTMYLFWRIRGPSGQILQQEIFSVRFPKGRWFCRLTPMCYLNISKGILTDAWSSMITL